MSEVQKLERRMVALEKTVKKLQGTVPKATNNVRKFGRQAGAAAGGVNKLKNALAGLAGFVGVGLGIGAIFQGLEKTDKASAALRTLGLDSDELGGALDKLRKKLDNNVSALELQQNAFEVAQAGFKDTADVTQILEAATKSAQAKLIDSTTTVKALTAVLNAYGLGADQAGDVSESFFQTIADGSLTLDQYAASIGAVAPLASAAGVGLQEVNAAIAVITQNGQSAGEATTAVRNAIQGIIAPSSQAKKLAAELGIAFNEQALEAKGLTGVLKDVIEGTDGSKEALTKLFGSIEAVNGVLALSKNDFASVNQALENQAKAAGKVQKAYEETSNTIQGSVNRIVNSFTALVQTNVVEYGDEIVAVFNGVAATFEALNSPAGEVIIQIGLVTAGVVLLTKAIVALKATALAAYISRLIPILQAGKGALALKTVAMAAYTKATSAATFGNSRVSGEGCAGSSTDHRSMTACCC